MCYTLAKWLGRELAEVDPGPGGLGPRRTLPLPGSSLRLPSRLQGVCDGSQGEVGTGHQVHFLCLLGYSETNMQSFRKTIKMFTQIH